MELHDGIREIALEDSSPRRVVPTDITRRVDPVPIHSLHDSCKVYPFITALSKGSTSVGLDVWLVNGKLLVGHDASILIPERTLDDLYIQPMLKMARFVNDGPIKENYSNWQGLYYRVPHISVQVVIRLRSDPEKTLAKLIEELEPLRKERYLTNYKPGSHYNRFHDPSPFRKDASMPGVSESVYTIVVQGDVRALIESAESRDYFFAETMYNVAQTSKKTGLHVNPVLSPVVIGPLEEARRVQKRDKHEDPRDLIKSVVSRAHSKGLRVMFTDVPNWPVYKRNELWKIMHELNADWLATIDVDAAVNF